MRYEIAKRAKNFRWNIQDIESAVAEDDSYFFHLEIIKDDIIEFSKSALISGMDRQEALHRIFLQMYRTIRLPEIGRRFYDDHSLRDSMYEAYLFSVLCSYLNSTKRIKGISLRAFARHYAPEKFDCNESSNYGSSLLDSESDRLRKARNRMLANGKVYIKNIRGAAIPKDAIHEWCFYYGLNDASTDVQDTFKRIGDLYRDINQALDAKKDDAYISRLDAAYKKFLSKLGKIKYEKYLDLQKEILSHINKDKKYYGLNMYRLERRLNPYTIMSEVKKLSACKSEDETAESLVKFAILKDICYPKIHEAFSAMSIENAERYAMEFHTFLRGLIMSSCLILDELVEQGILGEDWEELFINEVNEQFDSVLYNPNELDFSITKDSQKQFERLLHTPVLIALRAEMTAPIYFEELLFFPPALR